jgi:hypothetical protein
MPLSIQIVWVYYTKVMQKRGNSDANPNRLFEFFNLNSSCPCGKKKQTKGASTLLEQYFFWISLKTFRSLIAD